MYIDYRHLSLTQNFITKLCMLIPYDIFMQLYNIGKNRKYRTAGHYDNNAKNHVDANVMHVHR